MAAANHQYVRKPRRIPDHPFVGAKYFSPGRRPLVAPNRLSVSAPHHLWHWRKIFRPYICHCYPAARSPSWPMPIIKMFANLFASPIIHLSGRNIFRPDIGYWWRVTPWSFLPHINCGTGEIFFAPTFAIVTPPPDRHHGRGQSSIGSQTSSHTRSSIVGAKYFSPKCRPLVAPNTLVISAPHHLWHGRKIFRRDVSQWWCVTT